MQSEPRIARNSVWALTISLAATLVIDFSFSSSGYLDVSVHRVPCLNLWIQLRSTRVYLAGFPHSDICGSLCICHSPQLFAAYHVFHRLLVPRHPPCALIASLKLFSDHCFVRISFWFEIDSSYGFSSGCYLSITLGCLDRLSYASFLSHSTIFLDIFFSVQFSRYNQFLAEQWA